MRRLEMPRTREILRLKHEVKLSLREIAQACNCGKSTVSDILCRAEKAGISWPVDFNDKQLMSVLYPPVKKMASPPEPDLEYIFHELKKKNVTLMLLWEEYKEHYPDGLMYSQFCERYKKFKKQNNVSMHKEHKAGEEMEVDWAGSTLSYVYTETGEVKEASIFVAVLPASSYPFAYAYADMKIANWIDAHVRAYEFFGGVPRITIPDNTKTAVIKADRIEPILNKSYRDMARHYHTTIIPARAGKPRDKGADENMVGNVSRRIIAALRNRQFFSIHEINLAMSELLLKFINRSFQKMAGNRRAAFEQIDKPCLQPLPATQYEYAEWKETKVQFNYHVDYDGFFYSVHHSYINKPCSIRATVRMIEIFIGSERVAAYPRNYNTFKRYVTLPDHMPEGHRAVSGWNSERFLNWAEKIGPSTREFIKRILESREYPVQTYRACMGIMRFSKSYSEEIMENASRKALERNTCSYKYFSLILKQVTQIIAEDSDEKIIHHDNVRGRDAFTGGGLNA